MDHIPFPDKQILKRCIPPQKQKHASTPKAGDGKNKIQSFLSHQIHPNYVHCDHFLQHEDEKAATYRSQVLSAEKQVLQQDEAKENREFIFTNA